MKHKIHIFTVLLALLFAASAVDAQQKYALLIGGDYHPGSEIPVGHQWNNGNDLDPVKGWDEFWNDTYLMWELLYDDPISSYSDDNITVLFAQGIDYTFFGQNGRYKSFSNFPEVPSITDGPATKANVMAALDDLADIEEEDYVFIWIMSNGGNTQGENDGNSFVYLWGYDPGNPEAGKLYDHELKQKLDAIQAHKKVVIVQAPHSEGFAQELQNESTIIITSSSKDEPASRANDTPYEENEWWGGVQYHHGEFGYHLYSPLNRKDPGLGGFYGTTSFSTANTYNDDVISFDEGIDWLNSNHNTTETPVVSDPNNFGETTSVQYSSLIFGEIYSFYSKKMG